MRLINFENGRLDVKFMWLPVFIGQNAAAMNELQIAGLAKFRNSPVTDAVLDEVNAWVIQWICKRFPIEGLDQYLSAIRNVKES
jgi:hypothetical protein